jgi:hypothetical protein
MRCRLNLVVGRYFSNFRCWACPKLGMLKSFYVDFAVFIKKEKPHSVTMGLFKLINI